MIPDLLDYASGRVPYGIWLLVAGLISFSFIWWFAWRTTGFWNTTRFWRVLGIGWALAFSLYVLYWSILKPPPIPHRVVVLAGEPGETSPGAWAEAVAATIRSRLISASEELTVLDAETAPSIYRAKNFSEIETYAVRNRVGTILQVVQDEADSEASRLRLVYRKYNLGKYPVQSETKYSEVRIRNAMLWGGRQAEAIFELKPVTRDWLNAPESVTDSMLVLHYLNFSIRRRGDYELAAAFFSSEALADSHWSAPRLELAKTRLASQPDIYQYEILTLLLDAARLDRENPEVYILLGCSFLKSRDWEEAESSLKLALNYAPDDPQVFYYLSRLLPARLEEVWIKRPEQLLRRALQLAPGYEAARVALISHYRNLQPINEAINVANEGLKVDPQSIRVLLATTAVEVERQQYIDAEVHLKSILQQDPTQPEALYNYGLCRFWQKDYNGAIAAFDSSYAHGGTVDNLFYIGKVYQDKGDYPTAIEWYQKRFAKMKDKNDIGAQSAREKIHQLRYLMDQDSGKKTGG